MGFHVPPQVPVDMLILLGDEDPVIHFRNVTGHSNFMLSESQGYTEKAVQKVRSLHPIII